MSFVADTTELKSGLNDILNLLGFAQNESIAREISRLYDDTDALAVFTVKVTIALFWWANHIASATSDALGYSQQMLDETTQTNQYQLETWQRTLRLLRQAELRRVYIHTTKTVQVIKKYTQQQRKVDLRPILKRLTALETWKKNTATPKLNQWTTFYAAWRKTYLPPVQTLQRWLSSPSTFAAFAIPPLLANLPAALGQSGNLASATAIEAALVKTWTRDSGAIWMAVQNWLVTEQ